MSDRPMIAPNTVNPLIKAGDMSGDITGPATIIQRLPGLSYDISWTGAPVGTFSVEVSNSVVHAADGTLAGGNWTALPASAFVGTLPAPAGSADNGFIDLVGTEAYAVRLVYNRTSGSGALTVVAAAKVW